MSLQSINFLCLIAPKTQPGQDSKGQGHYSKVKGQIKVPPGHCTPTSSNQCSFQVSTLYTLRYLRYSPDTIFKLKVTTARQSSNQGHTNDVAHLHAPTNVPSFSLLNLVVSVIQPGQTFSRHSTACQSGCHG